MSVQTEQQALACVQDDQPEGREQTGQNDCKLMVSHASIAGQQAKHGFSPAVKAQMCVWGSCLLRQRMSAVGCPVTSKPAAQCSLISGNIPNSKKRGIRHHKNVLAVDVCLTLRYSSTKAHGQLLIRPAMIQSSSRLGRSMAAARHSPRVIMNSPTCAMAVSNPTASSSCWALYIKQRKPAVLSWDERAVQ